VRVLFIGDVVAHPGKRIMKKKLTAIKKDRSIDICVVNAENAAGGMGINAQTAKELFSDGADILTMGNHTYSCSDYYRIADVEPMIVRPGNVSPTWKGNDVAIVDLKEKGKLLVANIMGQVNMAPCDSPFHYVDRMLPIWKDQYHPTNILIDFHAEATAEKIAFGYYCDGRVSLVLGTHTHVQTADERVLERGTGYITDVGMTGTYEGVIGMNIEASLRRFVDRLPTKYDSADGKARICGIIAECNSQNGKCISLERIEINDEE